MEKNQQLEPRVLNLLTIEGFLLWYYQLLPEYAQEANQHKKAWEATERAHMRYFNKNRYTSYESFKSAVSRYNKKKRNK